VSMKWHGAKVSQAFKRGIEDGLTAAGEAVLTAAQKRAPEDTNKLRQSGQLDVEPARRRAVVSFGRGLPDARAAIVHEKLEIHHDNGSAKYLENPLRELVGEVRGLFADAITKRLS
jgi:hypothetical protein